MTIMNILYVHGFGSSYNPENSKIDELTKLGDVYGINLDYTQPKVSLVNKVIKFVAENTIDVIVGCSMGGHIAAAVSEQTGIKFVALNPAITPQKTLKSYEGQGVTYAGNEYYLHPAVIGTYTDFTMKANGVILLDMGDEVLDANCTYEKYKDIYTCITFEGGSHRFDHMADAIPFLKVWTKEL